MFVTCVCLLSLFREQWNMNKNDGGKGSYNSVKTRFFELFIKKYSQENRIFVF